MLIDAHAPSHLQQNRATPSRDLIAEDTPVT